MAPNANIEVVALAAAANAKGALLAKFVKLTPVTKGCQGSPVPGIGEPGAH